MTQWGLDTLFNPAKRHMDEEKRRLQSTREEVGDNSGGKRIDLESGKVTIKRADEDAERADDGSDSESDAGSDTTSDSASDSGAASDPDAPARTGAGKPAPSAAAIRAAKRRGRDLR